MKAVAQYSAVKVDDSGNYDINTLVHSYQNDKIHIIHVYLFIICKHE